MKTTQNSSIKIYRYHSRRENLPNVSIFIIYRKVLNITVCRNIAHTTGNHSGARAIFQPKYQCSVCVAFKFFFEFHAHTIRMFFRVCTWKPARMQCKLKFFNVRKSVSISHWYLFDCCAKRKYCECGNFAVHDSRKSNLKNWKCWSSYWTIFQIFSFNFV